MVRLGNFEGRGKKEEGRRKKEEGRRKKEEGRRKKEEGRRKKEEALSTYRQFCWRRTLGTKI
ncbi:MAG: hypothetical protein EAZ25_14680 [Oscillatoriales cyanobacterium]|nr:MAG: hypothetical protein EAZ25_14680 [Oscillatoriales cyanobacterium]